MTTTTEGNVLVFKDQAEGYYLLPQELFERGRVPAERAAEVERIVADAGRFSPIERDDVQGHIVPLWGLYLLGCAAIGSVSAAVIGATGPTIDDYWSGD